MLDKAKNWFNEEEIGLDSLSDERKINCGWQKFNKVNINNVYYSWYEIGSNDNYYIEHFKETSEDNLVEIIQKFIELFPKDDYIVIAPPFKIRNNMPYNSFDNFINELKANEYNILSVTTEDYELKRCGREKRLKIATEKLGNGQWNYVGTKPKIMKIKYVFVDDIFTTGSTLYGMIKSIIDKKLISLQKKPSESKDIIEFSNLSGFFIGRSIKNNSYRDHNMNNKKVINANYAVNRSNETSKGH